MHDLPIKKITNKTTYELVKHYVEAFEKNDKLAWDEIYDEALYPADYSEVKNGREEIFNEDKFIKALNKTTDEKFKVLTNIYQAPSINNNFLTKFIENAYPKDDKYIDVSRLIFTNGFKHIRRLDMQCTYINMIISLLKLTSFYDAEYDLDYSFFNDDHRNPYNSI